MSAPEFGQRAAHGAEKTPKPSQKCREISSSEISTNNSAASAVVVQTFPNCKFNVDANSGHAFGILLAAVGALRPCGAPAPVN